MAFNPQDVLVLRYRNRKLAVFRKYCLNRESLISVAQRNFGSLQGISARDVVLMATIPGYPDTDPVEISPELWSTLSHVIDMVTITLESEMQSTA